MCRIGIIDKFSQMFFGALPRQIAEKIPAGTLLQSKGGSALES